MENKGIISCKEATWVIICYFVLFEMIFGLLYSFVYSILSVALADLIYLLAIISIILQGIIAYISWRCSVLLTFKKQLIQKFNVHSLIVNMIIFTIVFCIFNFFTSLSDVNKEIDETIKSNINIILLDNAIKYFDGENYEQYQEEKDKIIKEIKVESYKYLAILQFGIFSVHLISIPMQKKTIIKYSV